MSEQSSPENGNDTPDELFEILPDGTILNIGDRVVITQLVDLDADQLSITDESMARYCGSFVLTWEGEVVFGGMAVPQFEVELEDGSTTKLMGFECSWMTEREHAMTTRDIADAVSKELDIPGI